MHLTRVLATQQVMFDSSRPVDIRLGLAVEQDAASWSQISKPFLLLSEHHVWLLPIGVHQRVGHL